MNSTDDFNAQWRASAHEAVKYVEDFPECFLVLPELVDGAIAQGASTKIQIQITLVNKERGIYKVIDNGKGVTNAQRLLSWASKESTNVHHRYGHGSKKCLTKWNKEYNAKWYVRYRTCDKRKNSGSLFTYSGPFQGPHKQPDEDENDEINLMPSGLEWCIEFNPIIFGSIQKPKEIFETIKEILTTRYSKAHFNSIDMILEIISDTEIIKESSKEHKWKSFQEMIEEEVTIGNCELINKTTQPFNDIQMHYTRYYLINDTNIKKVFPFYGQRRMKSSRLHISLAGRTIEIAPFWTFTKRGTNHNDLNGHFGFVDFEGDYTKAPTPATTKVSFYENCEIYKKFMETIINLDLQVKPSSPIVPNPPPKQPSPPPKQPSPQPKQPKLKNISIKFLDPDVYYKLVYLYVENWDEFDSIQIYCNENKKSYKLNSSKIKIDNLDNNKGYTFEIRAELNGIKYNHEFEQIIPNQKKLPLCPIINKIKDDTHDIQIYFAEPQNIGIPITYIKIYSNKKVLETLPYSKEVKLSHQIHSETTMQISYLNEIGESGKTQPKKVKLEKCTRMNFSKPIIEKILNNSEHKCNITGVRFDSFNRYDIDHKNGFNCDISEYNCQPLLVELHSIKSNDKNFYELLRDNKEELLKYKIKKINGFLDSLSPNEKDKIKFNHNTCRIEN